MTTTCLVLDFVGYYFLVTLRSDISQLFRGMAVSRLGWGIALSGSMLTYKPKAHGATWNTCKSDNHT